MKLNKLHPYLPQETRKPVVSHPKLHQEIKQARELVQRAEKDLVSLRKRHLQLETKYRGPFGVEMIEATAKLKRARIECRVLKQKLYQLVLIERDRKKRK